MHILFNLVIGLLILGVLGYIVAQIPMLPWVKNILNAVVVLFVVIWVVGQVATLFGYNFPVVIR